MNALSAHQESVVYRLKLQEIEQHESGINQLCGLVLQSAKQGISTVHGNSGWGMGRTVGSTKQLGNAIVQAKNQEFHYEEGDPGLKVRACFAHLHAKYGIPDNLTQNLARSLSLICWGGIHTMLIILIWQAISDPTRRTGMIR